MTEMEKMLSGQLYDCGDSELLTLWRGAKKLMKAYNDLDFADREGQMRILDQLLGSKGPKTWIAAPFFVDYGKFIHFGDNCEVNMNCVFLDGNTITIGDNALIAPGVHIYTVFHPVRAQERFGDSANRDFSFCKTQSAPVKIGNNVWIGGGSIILPGVTIGDGVTVGAGSVVTKSLPDNVLAVGNPCRIIKSLE